MDIFLLVLLFTSHTVVLQRKCNIVKSPGNLHATFFLPQLYFTKGLF